MHRRLRHGAAFLTGEAFLTAHRSESRPKEHRQYAKSKPRDIRIGEGPPHVIAASATADVLDAGCDLIVVCTSGFGTGKQRGKQRRHRMDDCGFVDAVIHHTSHEVAFQRNTFPASGPPHHALDCLIR
jgi:hypothetical protein